MRGAAEHLVEAAVARDDRVRHATGRTEAALRLLHPVVRRDDLAVLAARHLAVRLEDRYPDGMTCVGGGMGAAPQVSLEVGHRDLRARQVDEPFAVGLDRQE